MSFNNILQLNGKQSKKSPRSDIQNNEAILREDNIYKNAFIKYQYSRNYLHSDRVKLIGDANLLKYKNRFKDLIFDQSQISTHDISTQGVFISPKKSIISKISDINAKSVTNNNKEFTININPVLENRVKNRSLRNHSNHFLSFQQFHQFENKDNNNNLNKTLDERTPSNSHLAINQLIYENSLQNIKQVQTERKSIKFDLQTRQNHSYKISSAINQNKYSNQINHKILNLNLSKNTQETQQQELNQVFPIKKFNIIQKYHVVDSDTLSYKIDQIIDKRFYKQYNYDQPSYKLKENTINLTQKLIQINEYMDNNIFKGTYESICPDYKYQPDPILTSKQRRQLKCVKNKDYSYNFKDQISDHLGIKIKRSGTKLLDIKSLSKKQQLKVLNRQRYKSNQQNEEVKDKVEIIANEIQENICNHSIQEDIPQYPKIQNDIDQPDQQAIKGIVDIMMKTLNSQDSIMKRLQSQNFKNEIKDWAKSQINENINQQKFLTVFQEFQQDLIKHLEFEKYEEEKESIDDNKLRDQLYSSYYNDLQVQKKHQRNQEKLNHQIISTLVTNNQANKFVNIQEKMEKDDSLLIKFNQIKNQLDLHNESNKQINLQQKMLECKTIKRKQTNKKQQQQIYKIAQRLMQNLKNIKQEQEKYCSQNNLSQAMNAFISNCIKFNCTPIDIHKFIIRNKLQLINITMQTELSQALANSIKRLVPIHVQYITLENNNIKDENLEILLNSISNIEGIKGISIIQNSIQKKSMKQLIQILQQIQHKQIFSLLYFQQYSQLQELILNQCKIPQDLLEQLLTTLKSNYYLQVFGISNQNFDQNCSQFLFQLIQNSRSLINLDLSYCQFLKSQNLIDFIQLCESQSVLQYLNISFNTVKDEQKHDFAISIARLLRYSKTLIHLNLSCCNFNSDQSIIIFESVKKSKTLQSIHFSGNNLDQSTVIQVRNILQSQLCKVQQLQEQNLNDANEKQTIILPDIRLLKTIPNNQMSDKLTCKNQNQSNFSNTQEEHITKNDVYIFSRILGHLEIQNGHRWVERNECWICNKWKYVLIIWSEIMGNYFYEQKPIQFIQGSINEKQTNNYIPIIIMGNFTNNKHEKMVNVKSFIDKIQKNNQPYLRIVNNDVNHKKSFIEQQQEQLKNNFFSESDKTLYLLNDKDRNISLLNKQWPKQLDKELRNKEGQFIIPIKDILEKKIRSNEQYFVYANYMTPKQTEIFIYSNAIKSKMYYKQIQITDRQNLITIQYKRIKKIRLNRKFHLKNSLFSQWDINLKEEYKKCFEADMQYSKINKFVKEKDQYQEVCDILLRNYEDIMEIYLHNIGMSNYPNIQWIEFTNLCNKWQLIDKNLTLSAIDRLFIAVNYEGVQGGLEDNPDKALCRYEFFEILVRISQIKFPDLKIADALSKNLQFQVIFLGIFLQDYLFQYSNHLSWMKFRQEQIWTLEVDDLLKANQSYLRNLYQQYQSKLKPNFALGDAKKIIQQAKINLNDKQISTAFAYSKLLIIDEMESSQILTQLSYEEFLEFICRVVQQWQPDINIPLQEKALSILQEMFKLIKIIPNQPKNTDLGDSESDYDDEI